MKLNIIKLGSFFFLISVLLLSFSISSKNQSYTGRIGATKKPDHNLEGCFCHYPSPESSVGVGIKGPSVVAPGSTSEYVVWVTKGDNIAGGFNVASWIGELNTQDPYAHKMANELTQSMPKSPAKNSDTIFWSFTYTAPEIEGTDTIYANGINVDSTLSTSNDHWNYAPNFIVNVSGVNSLQSHAESESQKIKLFPNPATSVTYLQIDLLTTENLEVTIQSMNGEIVRKFSFNKMKKGMNELEIDIKGITPGLYHVKIKSQTLNLVKPLQIHI